MKETHFAYKITHSISHLNCSSQPIEEEKMVNLLELIEKDHSECIYWIFKQINDQPKQKLCLVDSSINKIFYHYSGEVEELGATIEKLKHKH